MDFFICRLFTDAQILERRVSRRQLGNELNNGVEMKWKEAAVNWNSGEPCV